MRKRFEPQLTLGSTSIDQVQIPTNSRDEFPPLLRALQFIFSKKELSEPIFKLLESAICTKKATGRNGMDLWTLFVLAESRLCLNADYDRLHYLANNDKLLRQILGVYDGLVPGHEFNRQTIIDNVNLLDESVLHEINNLIVKAGHNLVKKKKRIP